MRNVMVVSSSRSGSNWLVQLLDTHPRIVCFGEVLKPSFFGQSGAFKVQRALGMDAEACRRLQLADPLALLQSMAAALPQGQHLGFKSFYYHVDVGVFDQIHSVLQPVVIHLYRDHVLDTYTSLQLATASGKWKQGDYGAVRLHFDVDDYRDFREKRRLMFEDYRVRLRATSLSSVELEYSAIGHDTGNDRVASFLASSMGIDPRGFRSPDLEKQRAESQGWAQIYDDPAACEPFLDDRLTIA